MGLDRWLCRLSNIDRYELSGGSVLRHCGWFRTESIELAEIRSFQVEYEMTFDRVVFHFNGSGEMVWLDADNDLLTILRREIPQIEVDSE
jgi:hypothetical protein